MKESICPKCSAVKITIDGNPGCEFNFAICDACAENISQEEVLPIYQERLHWRVSRIKNYSTTRKTRRISYGDLLKNIEDNAGGHNDR